MKKKLLLAVTAAMTLVASAPLEAALQSHTFTYSSLPVAFPFSASSTFYVPAFDPALGALTQVEIVLTLDSRLGSRIENTSTSSGNTITVNQSQRVEFDDPSAGPGPISWLHQENNSYSIQSVYDGVGLNFSQFAVPGLPMGSGSSYQANDHTASSLNSFNAANPAFFTGAGLIAMPLDVFTAATITDTAGNNQALAYSELVAGLTVNYYYAPVPEPATMAAGFAAAGFVLFTMFRKRK